jgi:MFS family permease
MVAAAGIINGKLVEKFGAKNMLRFGISLALICSLFIILLYMLNGLEFYSIVVPVLIMDFGVMFVFPNAFAVAMGPFNKNAGYAGALYSFLQILGGGILGVFLTNFSDENQLILGLITFICLFLSILSLEFLGSKSH